MRIRIIIPSRLHPDYINAEMCDLLRRELPACGEAEIVDLSPDIVHIFGIEFAVVVGKAALSLTMGEALFAHR